MDNNLQKEKQEILQNQEENRVRIVDIADALGVSTATVSNVIHGKTKKISVETISRVRDKIEEMNYIPNMAGILLSQSESRIIGVVINDGEKYEGRVLEDGFVTASLNALSKKVNEAGYFLMIKTTKDWGEISKFASMWNMVGLILMGFCEAEYKQLRETMRIPFVVYDGYLEDAKKIVNLVIDHYDGGYQAGKYLKEIGHKNALCLADNFICMDKERIDGFIDAFAPGHVKFLQIPMLKEERNIFYEAYEQEIKKYTAVFAVSDYYAIDFIRVFQAKGYRVPEDISVVGFDDSVLSREYIPTLTTIHQDAMLRAEHAIKALQDMRAGQNVECKITLPVELVIRESTRRNGSFD